VLHAAACEIFVEINEISRITGDRINAATSARDTSDDVRLADSSLRLRARVRTTRGTQVATNPASVSSRSSIARRRSFYVRSRSECVDDGSHNSTRPLGLVDCRLKQQHVRRPTDAPLVIDSVVLCAQRAALMPPTAIGRCACNRCLRSGESSQKQVRDAAGRPS
jgi:hypothetical protein